MGRLISWPVGVSPSSMEVLSGPREGGGDPTESMTGFVQTVSSPYGVWQWQFGMPPMRDQALRRWRGMVTALHAGANAVRVPFTDPDFPITAVIPGVTVRDEFDGVKWSNGRRWSNGETWSIGRPCVAVAAAAARGDTTFTLADAAWGRSLGYGDMLGFVGVFALHVVTEALGSGTYRVWPPLRAPLTTASRATLAPVLAMRLQTRAGANLPRGVSHAEGLTITLTEIEHRDVLAYFAG